MGEEFKDFTTTPTLTFGETPDTQELPSTVAEETELVADSAFNESRTFHRRSIGTTHRLSYSMAQEPRRRWLIFPKMH